MITNSEVLYLTDIDKDTIWETYLSSYPEGTNNKTGNTAFLKGDDGHHVEVDATEYTCTACRQFLRPYGNIVTIVNNKLVSIWDIDTTGLEHEYIAVANALSQLVKSAPIKNVFITDFQGLGLDKNNELNDDKSITTWQHFYYKLPKAFVNRTNKSIESVQGTLRDTKNVFKRALDELKTDAIETTIELINQKSIYRGEEFKGVIEAFLKYKKEYADVVSNEQDNYCWVNSVMAGTGLSKIRNSAIGTLLVDISKGKELDYAVSAFEKIMAPTNYKRPNAILTKSMIEAAQRKIQELGFEKSLGRQFATIDDITVNNILFANRDSKKAMDVFDELANDISINPKKFNKVEEVNIDDFISNILPDINNIELFLENKHSSNLMSLIAPTDKTAPSMFKWDNPFSWEYDKGIADSMKQRVKAAGGNVDGVMRFSIQWNDGDNNRNDFDAHCIEPNGNHIYFQNKGQKHPSSGMLDVDIQDPGNKIAVENITWGDKSKMPEGNYKLLVHNYSHNGGKTGFTAEYEYDGQIHSFVYDKELLAGEKVQVAEINFSKSDGIKFINALPSTTASKEVWGLNTNKFHIASIVMNSPNHWDGNKTGNKHYFFMLEGCKTNETPRGFFNEFLKPELLEEKRVFEALGSKMKVKPSDVQLSGLGFSSTQRNDIIVKVEGKFTRTIKLIF